MNPLVRRPDCNNARIILRKKKTIDNEVVAIEMPSWKGMRKYEVNLTKNKCLIFKECTYNGLNFTGMAIFV